MLNQKAKKNKGAVIAYWLIVAALLAVIICVNPVNLVPYNGMAVVPCIRRKSK